MLACQISRKSWARQDQLCHLAFTFGWSLLQISKSILFQIIYLNSKMTRTKKTLGRNWTCYHNYYGMNHVLERACSKKLHWNRETIREYTVSHAPEVNHQNAMQYVNNPPPLPDNDNDNWFWCHPKLPGSSKAPRKQLKPKGQKKKGKA